MAALIIGGGVYYYQNKNVIPATKTTTTSNTQTTTTRITSQISGVPSFDITYPTQFGQPTVSMAAYVSSPLENVTFYKPGSPHNYPNIDSNYFLNIGFNTDSLKPGETLESHAGGKNIQYHLTVDGHQAIGQAISNTDPFISYYIDLGNNSLFSPLFDGLGSKHKGEIDVATIKSIVQSIKFAK